MLYHHYVFICQNYIYFGRGNSFQIVFANITIYDHAIASSNYIKFSLVNVYIFIQQLEMNSTVGYSKMHLWTDSVENCSFT